MSICIFYLSRCNSVMTNEERIVRAAQKFLDSITFSLNLVENVTLNSDPELIKKDGEEEAKRQSKRAATLFLQFKMCRNQKKKGNLECWRNYSIK